MNTIDALSCRLVRRLEVYRQIVWVRWCALSRRMWQAMQDISSSLHLDHTKTWLAFDRLKTRERELRRVRCELDRWIQRLHLADREDDADLLERIGAERCSPPE